VLFEDSSNNPNPKTDDTANTNTADIFPSMPIKAILKPYKAPFLIAKKTAGPGVKAAIKVIVRNK